MNEKLLKSEHRKEQILLTALTIPALISITLIIVIPVGWLFSLSFIGKTGDFSFENYFSLERVNCLFANVFLMLKCKNPVVERTKDL